MFCISRYAWARLMPSISATCFALSSFMRRLRLLREQAIGEDLDGHRADRPLIPLRGLFERPLQVRGQSQVQSFISLHRAVCMTNGVSCQVACGGTSAPRR